MTDYYKQAFDAYVTRLTRLFLMEPIVDISKGCQVVWLQATGQKITPYINPDSITIWIHMDTQLPNGEYLSKEKHVGRLLAHIRDNIEPYLEDEVRRVDNHSEDFRFKTHGLYPDIMVYVLHGGKCNMVKVGTRTVEEPIYKLECN